MNPYQEAAILICSWPWIPPCRATSGPPQFACCFLLPMRPNEALQLRR